MSGVRNRMGDDRGESGEEREAREEAQYHEIMNKDGVKKSNSIESDQISSQFIYNRWK